LPLQALYPSEDGCALLAGVEAGYLYGIELIREKIKISKEFIPDASNNEIYKRII